MMKIKPPLLTIHKQIVRVLFCFLWISALPAADLVFTPAAPSVEAGKQIAIAVSGARGQITWNPSKGQVQGIGTQVTYTAPDQPGLDVVTVFDNDGNVGTLKITITATQTITSLENANWEVFTNRSYIQAIMVSEAGQTLLVGTTGGLEQRDAQTGELKKVLTNLDGLPNNSVRAFIIDKNEGLWIATAGGLAHINANATLKVFNQDNTVLPSNNVSALLGDGQGGIWVGTENGLAHRHEDGRWEVFNQDNSQLPNNGINALITDGQGGIWIGTGDFLGGGLAHLSASHTWTVFDRDNSKLPDNGIISLLQDGAGGIWIGTWYGGLAHKKADGDWDIFNNSNSALPDNWIVSLFLDGNGGIWVGTSEGGLAHLNADGTWETFNKDNSPIPANRINAIIADSQGGLWVGTGSFPSGGGLLHFEANGGLNLFNQEASGLPHNEVTAVIKDGHGGVWVGTSENGLAHFQTDGAWQIFNTNNSQLPANRINALLADNNGGLWIATSDGGLVHYQANDTWEIFTPDNSGLPDTYVNAIIDDGLGGLWVGTDSGLVQRRADGTWALFNPDNFDMLYNSVYAIATDGSGGIWIAWEGITHLNADGSWKSFNKDNSTLPDNDVISLLRDDRGGLWIGTYEGGLVHKDASDNWEIFNQDNSKLPANRINTLTKDNSGGLWVGTENGLAHFHANGSWDIFKTDNSGLPSNWINSLHGDNYGGVWIGAGLSGLAHLTFGQKSTLCTQVNANDCEALITGKRAAILVHPRGQGQGYNQAVSIEFMASHAYRTLQSRGYENDEIYFLSYKPDVDTNGDGFVDRNVVDGPITAFDLSEGKTPRDLTQGDVQQAFDWAKEKGKLEQPLIVIFVDHALTGKLRLDPFSEVLTAQDLGRLLDDYQNVTQNPAIVILEACHTGSLIGRGLAGPNRVVITSTGENQAYYDNLGSFSFSKFYFDNLRRGENFFDAFQTVKDKLSRYGHPFNKQIPQLDDDGDGQANGSRDGRLARKACLNGCFGALSGEITLEAETTSSNVTPGQTFPLSVRAGITEGRIKRVWALVLTPEASKQRNEEGFSLIPTPIVNLQPSSDISRWQGSFNGFQYKGQYVVTFMAEDNEGFITSSSPIVLTLPNGPEVPETLGQPPIANQTAYHNNDTLRVSLPALPEGQVQYVAVGIPDGTIFVLAKQNGFEPFKGDNLPAWQGGEIAIEVPINAELPRGQYTLYLLRVPQGIEPLNNRELWKLGNLQFTVE